jgi:hypothetical protein
MQQYFPWGRRAPRLAMRWHCSSTVSCSSSGGSPWGSMTWRGSVVDSVVVVDRGGDGRRGGLSTWCCGGGGDTE